MCVATGPIRSMRDKHDHVTLELLLEDEADSNMPAAIDAEPSKRRENGRGGRRLSSKRPGPLGNRIQVTLLSSTVIDLSAIPPWKRSPV